MKTSSDNKKITDSFESTIQLNTLKVTMLEKEMDK